MGAGVHGRIPFRLENAEPDALDLRDVLDFFYRRWKFIASAAGLILLLTLFVLYAITPQYTATTQVLLDPQRDSVLGAEAIMSELTLDSSMVDSQVALLQSRSLLRRVVEKHKLVSDPEFGANATLGLWASWRASMFGAPEEPEEAADVTGIPPGILASVERLRDGLEVAREGRSYVIGISVTSENPAKAARLANAVADAYVVDQLEAGYEAAKRASDWLSDRLESLRAELRRSEDAVEKFRSEHKLVATNTGTVTEQQLSEINAELVSVRAETAEKRAKFEQAEAITERGGNLESVPDVLRSTVISALRGQYAEVTRREADLVSRYGGRHPEVVNVSAERRDVERQIKAEVGRIIANLKNDYEVAATREQSLEQSLAALTGQTGVDNQVAVRLRELERVAAANKTLYESFLSRAKIAEEQTTLANHDSRIISAASVPMDPSFPQKKLILALALVMGLGLGTGGAFLLDMLNAGFMTPRQVEDALELPVLSSVPRMSDREITVNGETLTPPRYLVRKPLSRYSEALRSLRSGVQMSDVDHPPKVVQITSTLPKEGKTTLAISLAFSAASSGQRVLLLDCDLRHPSVSKYFGLEERTGLVDLLTGSAGPERLVHVDEETGLHVVPAGSKSQNPPDLLTSARMQALMSKLRESYDYIVVDSPPVGPVIDPVVLTGLADKVIFAVRWGTTPREAVGQAVRQLPGDRKIAGVAFTIIDEARAPKYGRYSYYGSSYYSNYYSA